MSSNLEKILKIGVFFVVFLLCVVTSKESTEEKAGSELSKKLNDERLSKRSLRDESSSKSEENVDDKENEEKNDGQARQSDLSDDADSSDSEDDRRISTKGLSPDDFEPESNPNIHERYSKDSASE